MKRPRKDCGFAMLALFLLAACAARPMAIPFRFYGTSALHPDGTRTAYLIVPGSTPDTNEILIANEGTVLRNHFRIVQIGVDRVLVEDTQDKRKQPLNLEKEATR